MMMTDDNVAVVVDGSDDDDAARGHGLERGGRSASARAPAGARGESRTRGPDHARHRTFITIITITIITSARGARGHGARRAAGLRRRRPACRARRGQQRR